MARAHRSDGFNGHGYRVKEFEKARPQLVWIPSADASLTLKGRHHAKGAHTNSLGIVGAAVANWHFFVVHKSSFVKDFEEGSKGSQIFSRSSQFRNLFHANTKSIMHLLRHVIYTVVILCEQIE